MVAVSVGRRPHGSWLGEAGLTGPSAGSGAGSGYGHRPCEPPRTHRPSSGRWSRRRPITGALTWPVPCACRASCSLYGIYPLPCRRQVARPGRQCAHPAGDSQRFQCDADMHGGYGFPISGVAATDAADGGVVSPGDVGFAISCGVRPLTAGLSADVAKAYGRVGQPVLVPGPMGTALTSWPGPHQGRVPSRCAMARRKLSHEPACRPAAGLCARTWPPRESRSARRAGMPASWPCSGRSAWSKDEAARRRCRPGTESLRIPPTWPW